MDKLLEELRREERAEGSILGPDFRAEIWSRINLEEELADALPTPTPPPGPVWAEIFQAWALILGRPQWVLGLIAIGIGTAMGTSWLAEGKVSRARQNRTALHLSAMGPYSPETPEGRIYHPHE